MPGNGLAEADLLRIGGRTAREHPINPGAAQPGIVGGDHCLFCQLSNIVSHDGKPRPPVTGSRRLDRCIQGEKVRLAMSLIRSRFENGGRRSARVMDAVPFPTLFLVEQLLSPW